MMIFLSFVTHDLSIGSFFLIDEFSEFFFGFLSRPNQISLNSSSSCAPQLTYIKALELEITSFLTFADAFNPIMSRVFSNTIPGFSVWWNIPLWMAATALGKIHLATSTCCENKQKILSLKARLFLHPSSLLRFIYGPFGLSVHSKNAWAWIMPRWKFMTPPKASASENREN